MSYDLRPRNSNVETFTWGAFSWPVVLEMGLGWPVGYTNGIEPGSFIWTPDKRGLCIAYNDGAHVTAKQAKEMAQIARWIVEAGRARLNAWEKLTPERRAQHEKNEYVKKPCGKDFLDSLEKFADWLEKSGGFNVH